MNSNLDTQDIYQGILLNTVSSTARDVKELVIKLKAEKESFNRVFAKIFDKQHSTGRRSPDSTVSTMMTAIPHSYHGVVMNVDKMLPKWVAM